MFVDHELCPTCSVSNKALTFINLNAPAPQIPSASFTITLQKTSHNKRLITVSVTSRFLIR